VLPPGAAATFELANLEPGRDAELVVRLAPPQAATLQIVAGGASLPALPVTPKDGWVELSARVPAAQVTRGLHVSIRAERGEVVLYHAWVLQPD
jgi:hypothetical protein